MARVIVLLTVGGEAALGPAGAGLLRNLRGTGYVRDGSRRSLGYLGDNSPDRCGSRFQETRHCVIWLFS